MPDHINDATPTFGIDNFTYEEVNILKNFIILWLDFVYLTRSLIHSTLGNLPEQTAIGNQLFIKLPKDFFNEFRKYFNDEESQEFLNIITNLISDNWMLTNAYKNNDELSIQIDSSDLHQTADRLAEFLASINSYYDKEEIKALLNRYIELKNEELKALTNGNYELETQIFEQIEKEAIMIGTYMAMGIIAMRRRNDENTKNVLRCRYCRNNLVSD